MARWRGQYVIRNWLGAFFGMLRLNKIAGGRLELVSIDEPKACDLEYDLRPNILQRMMEMPSIYDILVEPSNFQLEDKGAYACLWKLAKLLQTPDAACKKTWSVRMFSGAPIVREALADLCDNTQPLYVSGRARLEEFVADREEYAEFMQRIYDTPSLFPNLTTLVQWKRLVYPPPTPANLRAQTVKIYGTAQMDQTVERAVCRELVVGIDESGYGTPIVNRHALVVSLPEGRLPATFSFPRARTLSLSGRARRYEIDASGCPMLDAVVFRGGMTVEAFTAVLESVPTLKWLPMCTPFTIGWGPFAPLLPEKDDTRVPVFRFGNIAYYQNTVVLDRAIIHPIVAAKAPHLLPQLEPLPTWQPHCRYDKAFNGKMIQFFMAVDRLVAQGKVAYTDPAALECVLRVMTVDNYFEGDREVY